MKNKLMYFILITGMLISVKAQMVFTDNFESNTLSNWTYSSLSGTFGIWSTTDVLQNPTASAVNGVYVAQFNCYNAPAGNSGRLQLVNSLDLSTSVETPRLRFNMYHNTSFPTYKDSIKVRWSIDGGVSWSNGMTGFARYTSTANGWQEHIVSLTGTQSQANVKICFDGISAYGNNEFIDDVSVYIPEPMLWSSCTSSQSNKLSVLPGTVKAQILDIQLVTEKDLNPITVSYFEFNTTGTTSPNNDILNIKLWSNSNKTNSNYLTAATQIGAGITTGLDGNIIITPATPLELESGTNYFWLSYDIATTAQAGNILDAQFVKVVTNSKTDYLPIVSNPVGARTIKNSLSGIYTIDPLSSSINNYQTFSQAITELNTLGVSNQVVFNVAAGVVFDEVIPIITATGTESNTIIFQKSGSGVNPKIQGTGSGSVDCGVWIQGGDYFIFDGIDVEDKASNTNATERLEYGYYLTSVSGTNGAQHNTIKNSTITLNRLNALSAGILSANKVSPSESAGANSYNRFYNIKIDNSAQGIQFSAINSAISNEGNEIGTENGGSTEIGGTIGIGGGTTFVSGIYVPLGEKNIKIFNTVVKNITSENNSAYGIFAFQLKGVAEIFNNKVYNISAQSTGTGKTVIGMSIGVVTNNTANVYNNMIYGLNYNPATATEAVSIKALVINPVGTMKGSVNLYNNTIKMETSETASSRIIDAVYGNVVIKNNILVNSTPNQVVARHYCIYKGPLVTSFISDYNNVFVQNTDNGFIGFYDSDRISISDWQSATAGLDLNSKNIDPAFVSLTDLHLQFIPANSILNDAAPAIPSVLQDIDGDVRGSMTDIGCDESQDPSIILTNQPITSIITSNYPNPFNPETIINFILQNQSMVNLTVYNVKGEVVQELLSEIKTAGMHSIKFNASAVNSGVYFYKLSTPETSITRKMLFCK